MKISQIQLLSALGLLLALPLWAQTPTDNPVLIDITTLDQLYAIRYDTDGDGAPDTDVAAAEATSYRTAFSLTGSDNNTCTGGCAGYELMNDLDFNDADGSEAGTEPSKWAKDCTGADCVTGTQADGSAGNIGWEPIEYFDDKGTTDDDTDDVSAFFSSRFHGNELAISNLYINKRSDRDIFAGLFGRTKDATLDSLNLMDVEVKVESTDIRSLAGGLAGSSGGSSSSSSITACSATGDVSSSASYALAGGLLGSRNEGPIIACSATGDVSSTSTTTPSSSFLSSAGGLVGSIDEGSNIIDSYATGNVTSTGESDASPVAGGLVGSTEDGSITDSYATGDVISTGKGDGPSYAGGLAGKSGSGSITDSHATGSVISTSKGDASSYAGGLVGNSAGRNSITASYATGNVISTAEGDDSSYAGGLVGRSSSSGSITDSYATGNVSSSADESYAGGLVGRNSGSITDSYATGNVISTAEADEAYSYVGGLVGRAEDGSITDCHATGNVINTGGTGENSASYVGGLVGLNDISITDSYATGDVSISVSYSAAGGLVGRNSGSITDSYATGNVSSSTSSSIGGLVGNNKSSITDSHATGDVTSTNTGESSSYAGGLAGSSSGGITASFATGDATSTTEGGNSTAGGLVGYNDSSKIRSCYATGNVSSSALTLSSYAGGLVGESSSRNSSITACYATGNVSSSSTAALSRAGGLVGYSNGTGIITACYATGNVSSASSTAESFAGGLVGQNIKNLGGSGIIKASYATGDVTSTSSDADAYAGGFIGLNGKSDGSSMGTITASYYASEATITGETNTTGAQTKLDLQSIIDGNGIYASWITQELDDGASESIDDRTQEGDVADDLIWDFGDGTEYPALKIDFDADPDATEKATVEEFGPQRAPQFRQLTYDFVVEASAADGVVIDTVRASIAHSFALSYSIISQKIDAAAATDTDFAFAISDEAEEGINVGELSVAAGATLAPGQITLGVQVDGNAGTDIAEVRIEVLDVAPAEPEGLTATVVSDTEIDLSWTAPVSNGGSEITGYQVQVSEDGGTTFTDLPTTSDAATLTYEHTGLSAGTERHYQVAAINSIGTGAYSSPVPATTHDVSVAPAEPTSLMATAVSETEIDLSWAAPTNDGGSALTGYTLQYNKAGGTAFGESVTGIAANATSYSHVSLDAGTEYTYRLVAINALGDSGPSNEISATTHGVPAAPESLTATAVSDTEIDLSWTAPLNTGGLAITGYTLELSTDDGNNFTVISGYGGTALSYSHTGLTAGTEYHYRVAAINSIGTGAYASVSTTTPLFDAPAGLTATAVSETRINLAWQAPTNDGGSAITSYLLEYSTDGGSTFMELHTTADAVTLSYSHTGLITGTEYHYRVAAINGIGTGAYASVSAMTHGFPAEPAGLTATAVSDTQIDLSWTAPLNTGGLAITGYTLELSTDGGNNFTVISGYDGTVLNYSHTGLIRGTEYHYRVAAINSIGTGAYVSVSAMTHGVSAEPADLTATAVSGTQIDLSWTAPTNTGGLAITGYTLEFSIDGGLNFTVISGYGGTSLSYSHTGLTAGTEYHYQLAAINSIGTGAYASVSTTTPLFDAPAGLTATAVSETQIDLSWTAPISDGGSEITSYLLEYSTDGGSTFMELHTTADAVTLRYSHTGLTAGTEYHYRVAAINSIGTGAYASVSATTNDVSVAPAEPTGLIAIATSSTQIDLSWTVPADGGSAITGYTLQYNKAGETAFGESITDIEADATSYSHTSLDAGTEYTYRLVAINDVGDSDPSNTVSATTGSGGGVSTFSVPTSESVVRLYPNPTFGEIRFTGLLPARGYTYKVYLLLGQEVLSGRLSSGKVDVSGLANGQYTFVLEGEEGRKVFRNRLLIVR